MRGRHAIVGFAFFVFCRAVSASDSAEMMYSRGLVEFHKQNYEQAMPWFDSAVGMDATDPAARYYRAMARAHLNQKAEAIADLQYALELKPDFYICRIELAGLLIDESRYDEAMAQLNLVENQPEVDGRAAFLKGLIYLRQGQLDEADSSFAYAAGHDQSLAATAAYYQGIIAYRRKDTHDAKAQFNEALRRVPSQSGIGREAASGLQTIRSGSAQRYMLYAESGFQYDTNVCLLPDDGSGLSGHNGCLSFDSSDVGDGSIGNESDGRYILNAGGFVRPVLTDRIQLTVGYEFYQSVQFHLQQFDLQDHRPRIQLTADLGPVILGALGQYDYYLLQTNSFLQDFNGTGWGIVPEGTVGRFEAFFRARRRDFKMLLYDVRDANNYSPGVRQLFYLGAPDQYVFLGYRYDKEDPDNSLAAFSDIDSKAFGYDGNEGSIGLRWVWPYDISSELGFAYRYERYDSQSSETDPDQPGSRRKDNDYRVRAYLELPWTLFADFDFADNLSFGLGYMFSINDSNQSNFDYNRNIVSATLQVRY